MTAVLEARVVVSALGVRAPDRIRGVETKGGLAVPLGVGVRPAVGRGPDSRVALGVAAPGTPSVGVREMIGIAVAGNVASGVAVAVAAKVAVTVGVAVSV